MKKILSILMMLILGVGLGGGAAFGVSRVMGPPPAPEALAHKGKEVETAFVPAGIILVPVVTSDGNLSGYCNFDVQLEVEAEKAAEVASKIPLLLHAVNLRAFRTPLAAGRQKVLPDLSAFSALMMTAGEESLGKGAVRRAVIMSAKPV